MAPSDPTRLDLTRLPPPLLARLKQVAATADGGAWLVGGFVRDLLLDRRPGDLDLVVAEPAVELARRLPVTIRKTTRFLTTTIVWPDGHEWDLVTARRETYSRPAALPDTAPGTLADDLLRRDFTINAIAADLAPERFGELIDPVGGVADTLAHRVRILHEQSFVDDPTRLFRAVRYAVRLGFGIEAETRHWFEQAVVTGQVELLTPDRLRNEVARSLNEADGVGQVAGLAKHDLLETLAPRLDVDRRRLAATLEAREALAGAFGLVPDRWLVLLLNLLPDDEPEPVAERLIDRLEPDSRVRTALRRFAAALARGPWERWKRSDVVSYLEPQPPAVLVAMAGRWPARRAEIEDVLFAARTVKPHLDGRDLRELGVPRGPEMGALLAELRRARLDGELTTREDEVRRVRAWRGEVDGA